MRFKVKEKRLYVIGDQRIIKKFLWLPKAIGNEVRWLEKVKIKQELRQYVILDEHFHPSNRWEDLEFIE